MVCLLMIANCYKKRVKMGIFIDYTLALLMFLSPSFVFGIENVEGNTGFFDLNILDHVLASEPERKLSLNKLGLNALAKLVNSEEERAFLQKLDHVSIVNHEFEYGNYLVIDDALIEVDRDLVVKGWNPVLMRRLDKQFSAIYLKFNQELFVVGVVVIALEGDKVLLGNMVGTLTQKEINQIGGYFEIDELKELE